jgi:NAD(P)-dependent dehydrogenase (short-subunit alcohol dehydrogenase family)
MKRTVLVTGGARGIGAAIAKEFLDHGHDVLTPRRAELDLASAASVEEFIRSATDRPVDVLINNAGINVLKSIGDLDSTAWQEMLQVNLTSPVRLTQAFLPGMQSRGWGRIVCVSSIFSLVTKPKRVAYSMTKAALNAFVRSVAVESGPGGVLANSLCPGYVETALTRQNNSPEEIAAMVKAIPAQRLAQPEELARVAYFLGSDENTYISGQAIVADGGFLCQ